MHTERPRRLQRRDDPRASSPTFASASTPVDTNQARAGSARGFWSTNRLGAPIAEGADPVGTRQPAEKGRIVDRRELIPVRRSRRRGPPAHAHSDAGRAEGGGYVGIPGRALGEGRQFRHRREVECPIRGDRRGGDDHRQVPARADPACPPGHLGDASEDLTLLRERLDRPQVERMATTPVSRLGDEDREQRRAKETRPALGKERHREQQREQDVRRSQLPRVDRTPLHGERPVLGIFER